MLNLVKIKPLQVRLISQQALNLLKISNLKDPKSSAQLTKQTLSLMLENQLKQLL